MASNTFGRQVVLPLTNKSGGGVIAGDVVVIDTANNDAFTTTTSAATTTIVGIAMESIANNAIGRVLLSGYAPLVNVNASVTRGNFGATHTVAKQAADVGASRAAGTFCMFLTGGTTPDAEVWATDLGGGSGAPTTVNYLVGTADGGLSNEIVVGTTPGGELGNTWASPTVDATHAGSKHLVRSAVGTTSAGASFQTTRGTYMKKITVSADGFIASIVCFVKGDASSRLGYNGVVFTDSAGAPVNIIAVTGPSSVVATNVTSTGRLNTTVRALTQPLMVWVTAGDYWIGINQNIAIAGLAFTAATGSDKYQATVADTSTDISIVATSGSTTDDNSIYANLLIPT